MPLGVGFSFSLSLFFATAPAVRVKAVLNDRPASEWHGL